MFVFEDIAKLTDRELQSLLREVDQKDLIVALKSASEELKEKVLGNMSERVRTFITEEMEFQGPMRLSEVEEIPTAHRATGSPTRGTRPGNYRSRRF
jgi:flagellar motor switch protein FliG